MTQQVKLPPNQPDNLNSTDRSHVKVREAPPQGGPNFHVNTTVVCTHTHPSTPHTSETATIIINTSLETLTARTGESMDNRENCRAAEVSRVQAPGPHDGRKEQTPSVAM